MHPTPFSSRRSRSVADVCGRWPCALALLLALTLLGCSGKPKEPVVVGKVTVNGSPAAFGSTITFTGDGKNDVSSSIGPGGAYTITNPPLGSVKITIKGTQVPVAGAASSAPEGMRAGGGTPVPAKYAKPDSGLTYTVTEGQQTHDIDLKP